MKDKLQFDFKTTQIVIQKISSIDNFKGKWDEIEHSKNRYLKELKQIATIQSIGSSTRIEGATLSDSEIEKLIKNIKISKLNTRDEQEVVGYYEALEFIYENYNEIKITENNILHLHNTLLKYSDKDQHHKGNYKKLSNKVVANYPDGTQKVIFNTTPPYLTQVEMYNLVDWTNLTLENKEIHPLMIIATFIYEFLSIHPFQDGNGRLSRLLTTLLLIQNGYSFVEYVSFENLIEQKKKKYYEVLMNAQKYRGSKKEIIADWIIFFLSSIEILIQKLNKKYEYFQQAGYLNERQKIVRDYIKKNQPVKLSNLQKAFPAISVNTIKKDLQYLTHHHFIQRAGKLKSTHYLVAK